MPSCILNDKKYELDIADTPMARIWLSNYSGVTFSLKTEVDKKLFNDLDNILTRHNDLFKKFGLQFKKDFLSLAELSATHVQIVEMQKTHKKSTDILNKSTNGDWDIFHDLLHQAESHLRSEVYTYSTSQHDKVHNAQDLTDKWTWEPRLTTDEFHASASFDRWHINVPTAELGRHPYECFIFSPDTWHREGSMLGQISTRIELQMNQTCKRPDKGYEQWCDDNHIPPAGNNFPLANFKDDFANDLLHSTEITINA